MNKEIKHFTQLIDNHCYFSYNIKEDKHRARMLLLGVEVKLSRDTKSLEIKTNNPKEYMYLICLGLMLDKYRELINNNSYV